MATFHKLTVTDIRRTIRDAVELTLKPDAASTPSFAFTEGQYLTFRREFDGEELRRSYSICAAADEGVLQVGIKRVDGGAFSTWANSELAVGDIVEAMPPMGNFHASCEAGNPYYLAFAGGSGITPLLSIIKTGLRADSSSRFTLVYANRGVNSIMFRDELEDIKNSYMTRFNMIHVLEDESQDIDLFRGRIDGKKCGKLFESLININAVDMAYICGPEPMMLAIRDALEHHGLSKAQIRIELFASGQPGRARTRAKSINSGREEQGIPGTVTIGGQTRELVVAPNTTLLEAALAHNIDAPYACKAGVCSTCKAKVLQGEVEMLSNNALEDYEVDAGFVLTCQCLVLSDSVVWDYDQAGH